MSVHEVILGAFVDELQKIAGFSSPSIVASPSPGGDGSRLSNQPAKPVTPRQLVGKAVRKTNLQKTNYTKPGTDVVTPNVSLTAEQKALPPPPVRM